MVVGQTSEYDLKTRKVFWKIKKFGGGTEQDIPMVCDQTGKHTISYFHISQTVTEARAPFISKIKHILNYQSVQHKDKKKETQKGKNKGRKTNTITN